MAFTGLRAELLEVCEQVEILVGVFNFEVSEVRHMMGGSSGYVELPIPLWAT